MSKINPQWLLNKILEGSSIEHSDIDRLLAQKVDEGLFLDYKDGIATIQQETKDELRKDVAAFANAEGGVIILGIADKTWLFSPCLPVGNATLTEWASSCIRPIAAQMSEIPHFMEIDHPKGRLLLVAVARSNHLVSIVYKSVLCWFIRVHDGTIQAPDYLVADLMLGRRKTPHLGLRTHATFGDSIITDRLAKFPSPSLGFQLDVNNNSPTWIEDLRVELLCWSLKDADQSLIYSDYLKRLITLENPSRTGVNLIRINLTAPLNNPTGERPVTLAPLSAMICGMRNLMTFPYGYGMCNVFAGLLVTIKGFDFSLYQIEIARLYPTALLSLESGDPNVTINITRMYGNLVRIAWEPC